MSGVLIKCCIFKCAIYTAYNPIWAPYQAYISLLTFEGLAILPKLRKIFNQTPRIHVCSGTYQTQPEVMWSKARSSVLNILMSAISLGVLHHLSLIYMSRATGLIACSRKKVQQEHTLTHTSLSTLPSLLCRRNLAVRFGTPLPPWSRK